MKIVAVAATFLTFTAAASPPPSPPDDKVAAAMFEIVGEDFRIRKTDHFTIVYDTSYDVLRPLIGRLEGTYDTILRFCEGVGLGVEPRSERFGVLLFDRREDFDRYRESLGVATTAAGFYHQQTNLAAFGNMLNTPQLRQINAEIDQALERLKQFRQHGKSSRSSPGEREALRRRASILRARRDAIVERFNRFVLQHEVAHQMFFNIGVHVRGADNPLWLVEGLACQFEVPESRAARGLGRINHLRLADLRDALGVPFDARRISGEELEAAVALKRLVPLAELVSDPGLFTRHGADGVPSYAQAWGLVYYLTRKHREPFAAYLRQLATRKPGVAVGPKREIDEFEFHFGPLDAQFQQAWVAYMLRLRLDPEEAGR